MASSPSLMHCSRTTTILVKKMAIWDRCFTFRYLLEAGAVEALKGIGFSGQVRAALIGLPRSGSGAVNIFEGKRTTKANQAHLTFPQIHLSDVQSRVGLSHREGDVERPDHRYSLAIEEDLNSRSKGRAWRFFVAPQSARVGEFYVYAALATPGESIDAVPQLRQKRSNGTTATSSLTSRLIREVLRRAWLFLSADPNGFTISSLSTHKFELIRTATAALVADALDPSGLHGKRDSDMLLSSISALPYEGRVGQGSIVIASPDSEGVRIHLHLLSPVPIDRLHAVRKMMEATTNNMALLLHQAAVYGVGRIEVAPQEHDAEFTRIDFLGRGSWQLRQGDRAILEVKDGLSRLPGATDFDAKGITDRLSWLIPGANNNALLRLARAARHNRHGAMLIISAEAAEEAHRLTPQSWAVRPTEIDEELMIQLTEMDGGVLVDPEGRCHAIGVILDGVAAGTGDPARGSRYNNPIRYLDTRNRVGDTIPNAVIIVYSTDGSVDILPSYPPKAERAFIKHLVARLAAMSTLDAPDLVDLTMTLRRLREHKFYLSMHQCEVANEALGRLDQSLTGLAMQEILRGKFEPDPRMDEERFLS